MHLHFERNCNAKCDCTIISLSWMGKVPDELPEDEGWKLNRTNYYQEGWLATAHTRGIVGVTFTTSHCKKAVDYPLRTNYNLRGHRSAVVLVKWNEPYQKLASCDSSGIIFVWIKYEGRWSIELINDRNTPVTHFAWSHDGRMALICYQDGFVLVGSVAGQRYWSSMLSLESTITCGIWTPDDLQVYFGTSNGGIVVMDVHGAMVAQVSLSDLPVVTMAWSCEKFKMEEGDDIENQDSNKLVLAVCLGNGCIFFMKSYDDVSPIKVYTGFTHLGPMVMEWSNSRHLLAVAGVTGYAENGGFVNMLKCYTETGELLYCTTIPHSQDPVSALTWGHNDKRLFVATGGVVHIAWVARRVASLQLLSRLKVASSLPLGESSVKSLPLPPRIKHLISNLFAQTIRCCVPESKGLREFVSRPPINGTRLHCTMIRHDDEHLSSGACYTLYLEYLGGLVPLLKGKRTSKIRPEFVIFDPQAEGEFKDIVRTNFKVTARGSDTSDTEKEDGCNGSPRVQRRRRRRRRSPADYEDGFTYVDTLPEDAKLVEVTSNIWGTKFKIHGLADCVPSNLGQITYKTSLLHLQPRQMSLVMTELSDDVSHAPDPSFNPKVFSEDEEDERNVSTDKTPQPHSSGNHPPPGGVAIPIAPMTPRRGEGRPRMVSRLLHRAEGTQNSTETNSRYFTAPRFIYQYPSLRERIEMRRAMYNVSKNPTGSSLPTREDHEILEKPPVQMDNVAVQTTPITEFNFEPESPLPSSSTRTQPSLLDSETSTSYTYHNDLLFVSKKMDEVVLLESHVDKKEPRRSEIEETGYPDVHLAEIISLCESLKFCDFGEKGKPRGGRPRQEKTETSFLNNQTPSKPIKSPNLQSPKNVVTCLNLQSTKNGIASCHFYENGGFDGIAANPSTDCASLSTQKVKTTREKRFNQERIGTDNMKNLTDETENLIDRMSRSCSVGYLDDVDTGLPPYDVTLRLLQKDSPKRLFLVGGPKKRNVCSQPPKTKSTLKSCGKSRSLDSGELLLNSKSNDSEKPQLTLAKKEKLTTESPESPTPKTSQKSVNETSIKKRDIKETTKENVTGSNICLAENSIESLPPPSPRLPRSQPVTPAMTKKKRNQSSSPIRKHLLNSPLLRRRRAKSKTESSDDDNTFSGDEAFTTSTHFKDLETFQKAQLRQKLKRGKVRDGNTTPKVRELVMHNKAPMWNESSQVYQLDFGGRVTQESAKNFQIEFKGKQVMQFGRIDGNAYTLDFQYPFSVLQAFSVALANVTQRLK